MLQSRECPKVAGLPVPAHMGNGAAVLPTCPLAPMAACCMTSFANHKCYTSCGAGTNNKSRGSGRWGRGSSEPSERNRELCGGARLLPSLPRDPGRPQGESQVTNSSAVASALQGIEFGEIWMYKIWMSPPKERRKLIFVHTY